MPTDPAPDPLLRFVDAILVGVRGNGPDLTHRQLAVLLITYLEPGTHTVSGLARHLKVPKPTITRILDRLGEFDFARRKANPSDPRSVLLERTDKGAAYVRRIAPALDGGEPHPRYRRYRG
jgi:DNA-binding MarR family transcriptional regulator